jgi:hypothetical protein
MQASTNLSFFAQTRFDRTSWEMKRTDLGSWSKYEPVELTVNYAHVTAYIRDLAIEQDKRFMVNFMLNLGTYQFQTDAFGLLGPAGSDSND